MHGGQEIAQEIGYGNPHGFSSEQVKEIDQALSALDVAQLYEDADPVAFKKNNIYPEIWKREPKEVCIGYVTEYLKELQNFISETAASNRAMIVYLA